MRTQSAAAATERIRPMIASRLSDFVVRLGFRLVARSLFRIRIAGPENIPACGPALLVSNHLTHLDAFLIGACVNPLVRFLVWKPYYDHKLLSWGLRLAKAIPIWDGPHQAADAIKRARAELERGHIVCIFAEGSISRTGELLPFRRGLEAIVRDLEIPVVPVHLGGLWESVFSFERGRFFWKRPRRLRHPVVVSFGTSMPASSTAKEIRQAVEQLGRGLPSRHAAPCPENEGHSTPAR
jgi:acyl-[acyl-carrier-protein]-phospholipid O-acyltransferase / long-chain-fatty-acid--[acyl-carrier-protein] ligase